MRIFTAIGIVCALSQAEAVIFTAIHQNAEAGPGVLSFAVPTISLRQNDGTVRVPLLRQGGTLDLVSVAYRTLDGSAVAGEDYVATEGIIVFTNGQQQATVYVPLINNSKASPDSRYFELRLDRPTGGAILASGTNVTIYLATVRATLAGEVLGVSVVDTNWVPLGGMANDRSYGSRISANGRYVCFHSDATNLVTLGVQSNHANVYRRDLWSNTTELVSVNADSTGPGNGDSWLSGITPDGRYVSFISLAANLLAGKTNWGESVFVRDMEQRITHLVSAGATDPHIGVGESGSVVLSDNGCLVAFASSSGDLVTGDDNDSDDVFVRNLETDTTVLVSRAMNSQFYPKTSDFLTAYPFAIASNRYVFFNSNVDTLVANDTNGIASYDLFVRDLLTDTTRLVNATPAGTSPAKGWTFGFGVSAEGRYVLMQSDAVDLLPGDFNGQADVFIRDLWLGETRLVSVNTNGDFGNGYARWPSMSADGRFVVFESSATDLVLNDVNDAVADVFERDMVAGATRLVSLARNGTGSADNPSGYPIISANGRVVAFRSLASNLAPGFTEPSAAQLFVRDLETEVTTLVSRTLAGFDTAPSDPWFGGLSATGSTACFDSAAPNMVPGDDAPDFTWESTAGDVFAWKSTAPTNLIDLRLNLSVATNLVPLSGSAALTAIITNAGTNPAPGIRLTADTPTGWTWTGYVADQGTCTINEWQIACALGELPLNGVARVTLIGQPGLVGPITLKSSIVSTVAPEHTPDDNHAQLTLFIAGPGTDADGDGLSDEWEWLFGFDPLRGSEPWEDADMDRMSNVFEFLAGTDPNDPESSLRIVNVHLEGDDVLIEFTTVAGRYYWLERNMGFPNGAWQAVGEALPGTGVPMTVHDNRTGNSLPNTIYRVRLAQ